MRFRRSQNLRERAHLMRPVKLGVVPRGGEFGSVPPGGSPSCVQSGSPRPSDTHGGHAYSTIYQPNSEACRKAEIARLQARSGVQRGALKPIGRHVSFSARTSCRRTITATRHSRNVACDSAGESFVRGYMALEAGERRPQSKKPAPKTFHPSWLGGGASHPSLFFPDVH